MPSSSLNTAGGGAAFGASQPSLFDVDQPFASQGAIPAGFTGGLDQQQTRSTLGGGGYTGGASAHPFDDDDGPGAYAFTAPGQEPYANRYKRSRWQRFKDNYLTDVDWTFGVNAMLGRKNKFDGVPREILLNDPEGNRVKGYEKNSVSTGKYGPITFLPKFLYCKYLAGSEPSRAMLTCSSRVLAVSQLVLLVHRVYPTGP